jgi:hypothetical protein
LPLVTEITRKLEDERSSGRPVSATVLPGKRFRHRLVEFPSPRRKRMQAENFTFPTANGSPPVETQSAREKVLQLLAKLLARRWLKNQQGDIVLNPKPKD